MKVCRSTLTGFSQQARHWRSSLSSSSCASTSRVHSSCISSTSRRSWIWRSMSTNSACGTCSQFPSVSHQRVHIVVACHGAHCELCSKLGEVATMTCNTARPGTKTLRVTGTPPTASGGMYPQGSIRSTAGQRSISNYISCSIAQHWLPRKMTRAAALVLTVLPSTN